MEGDGKDEDKLKQLTALGRKAPYRIFWKHLCANRPDFPLCLFYGPLCAIEGVGRVTARNLYESGFRTMRDLHASTPEALTKVRGVGPKLAARLLATKDDLAAPGAGPGRQ